MDLVVTIDNSTAHLAAALGVPVWVLLPFAPDWRWHLAQSHDLSWRDGFQCL
jgi:ADP-heptose:LPS heptosyltransferase